MDLSDFVPLLEPPEGAEARWISVRGAEVALMHPAELGVTPVATHVVGAVGSTVLWAADLPADAPVDPAVFSSLFALHERVSDGEWHLAGRAVQLVEWGRTHRFCGRCGTPTTPADGERALVCPACGLKAYPRLAPAAIVLVERDDTVLLARNVHFPLPMYSLLAGFVEPGETLEQTVHREVREEVGIEVTDVRYVGSQPWPFPHSLMIGFTARWSAGELRPDPAEIADAGWYRADELPMIPPRLSIARVLIDRWVAATT